ncbi:hypothetical protein B0J11DRAFT_526950 [Dendryphion nanum]|uniref:Atg28p n=1 Tax=Dendryphion nanum TaxID=256645 RepID=A0A9P9DXQ5_9PLEO|nr:hypothetical protein B0J11DRAFT_526950 [Dendryphion nanum]
MSLFNSVLGSLSPKFRSSFEDPHAREHELPLYKSPPLSPRVPPPIASTILWKAPNTSLSPPARVPDDLLAIQRRARHLEQQLQELLDAQADGLMSGLAGNDSTLDDAVSNGSTTPTVSSTRDYGRYQENEERNNVPRKKMDINTARRGILRRIQQLSRVKAEEMNLLEENLQDLQEILDRTTAWGQKRVRLERRIRDIEGDGPGARTQTLKEEASKLEQEIRLKEEELWALKTRHRRVLNELADNENNMEAKLSSYKTSLAMVEKDVVAFLARPPNTNHIPLSQSPFLSLPPKRRTLELAHEFWQEEQQRLFEKCQSVDTDRVALDDGAGLWKDVVKSIAEFEATLESSIQGGKHKLDPSNLLARMDSTLSLIEEKLDLATSKSYNLLVCAIGAELEAFKQGREVLEGVLGLRGKGKGKLVDTEDSHTESEEEGSSSAIRITRSPQRSAIPSRPKFFDTDDEDPDPELLISHQDTDPE